MIGRTAITAAAVLGLCSFVTAKSLVQGSILDAHDAAILQAAPVPQQVALTFEELDASLNKSSKTSGYNPGIVENGDAEKAKRWIIGGKDDRRYWPKPTNFPGAAIGRLLMENDELVGSVWTGALVGPRHVLTIKHHYKVGKKIIFQAAYDQSYMLGEAVVEAATTIGIPSHEGECERQNDWIVLVLNGTLGNDMGYFGVRLPDPDEFDKKIFTHQGYPMDRGTFSKKPYRQWNTQIWSNGSLTCDEGGPLKSDTDFYYGQEGGPIWMDGGDDDGYNIWGVHSYSTWPSSGPFAFWASGIEMVRGVARTIELFP